MSTRRERGLTQNIYLVKLDVNPESLVFHILGTSHHVYKVVCEKKKDPKCTCPDFTIRKHTCKHIYFVCEKVIQIPPFDWSIIENVPKVGHEVLSRLPNLHVVADDYYTKKYNTYLQGKGDDLDDTKTLTIRNTECCVCLCDIDIAGKASKDVMVCPTCKNGIHSICWNKWKQVNRDGRCVYCRTEMTQSLKIQGWGLLLE